MVESDKLGMESANLNSARGAVATSKYSRGVKATSPNSFARSSLLGSDRVTPDPDCWSRVT